MSGQRLPNAILEREWLALRWHMQGLLSYERWTNIESTVGNYATQTRKKVICQCSTKNTANLVPMLAQRITAIWDIFSDV